MVVYLDCFDKNWKYFSFNLLKYQLDPIFYQKPPSKLIIETFLLVQNHSKPIHTANLKLFFPDNIYRIRHAIIVISNSDLRLS